MHLFPRMLAVTALLSAAPGMLFGQFNFDVKGRPVQIHSFLSQGFAYSDHNNYLTMKTSEGSFALTDGGVNVSVALTDKFRVGAQAYARNIGELGQGRVELDWAYGDYKFADWIGVRAGKVKTALGLYNDAQDAEFLHTWAILPQSTYPLDLRSNTIVHTGVDVYGEVPLSKAGSLGYTGYYGVRSFDTRGGYYYFSSDQGIPITDNSGRAGGADLRWNTPLEGLMVGASWTEQTQNREGYYTIPFLAGLSYSGHADPQRITAGYADYSNGKWHFNAEFRRSIYWLEFLTEGSPAPFRWNGSDKGWFVSAAYRVTDWLEVGSYHSRYWMDAPWNPDDAASNHIHDQTITARFDIKRWWNVKVEGHFIDGTGDVYSAHGFYPRVNPEGMERKTNMLVLRTGWTF